jgi:hypothetical protein
MTPIKPSQTWSKFIADILAGYLLLAIICTLFMSTPASLYLFLSPSQYDDFIRNPYNHIKQGTNYGNFIVFFIACAAYTVTKIILFAPRQNNWFSRICGSIRRFTDDYVWCFYVCFYLCIFIGARKWGECGLHDITLFEVSVLVFVISVYASCFLIPIVMLAHILLLGYRIMRKIVIKSPKQPAQTLQYQHGTPPKTIRGILNDCVLRIRDEFFYNFAVFVLLTSISILIALLYYWYLGDDWLSSMVFGIRK